MQVSPVNGLPDNQIHLDNNDFDRAVSLSLKVPNLECFALFWGVASIS